MAVALAVSVASCGKSGVKTLTFPSESAIPVTVTLLKRDGDTGRDSAVQNGYRPQVKFSTGTEITCQLALPDPAADIAPGQSADVTLSCMDGIAVPEDQLDFAMLEGGRKAGTGHIRK